MKTVSLLLASMLCTGTPAVPGEGQRKSMNEQRVNVFLLGNEVVREVRGEYAGGGYKDFLNEMDEDYRKAKKSNQLEGLIEIRKDIGKIQIDPEFAKSYREIQKNKNKQLMGLASGGGAFDQKLRSAAQSIQDPSSLLLELNYKAPGSGANADENALIDISLEYSYKETHLDSMASTKKMGDLKQKHMVLEMQKMEKMVAASKNFADKDLKAAVEEAAAMLDARIAKSYDTNDLIALGRGQIKPANSQEENAAAIVSSSQGELAELHRHLLNSVK
jgi:hypothetical protein